MLRMTTIYVHTYYEELIENGGTAKRHVITGRSENRWIESGNKANLV